MNAGRMGAQDSSRCTATCGAEADHSLLQSADVHDCRRAMVTVLVTYLTDDRTFGSHKAHSKLSQAVIPRPWSILAGSPSAGSR